MRYLLDTSIFLRALAAPQKLNRRAQEILSSERQGIFFSAASAWEISIKHALGKLELPEPPAEYVSARLNRWGLHTLDITTLHALAIGQLPPVHQDPFDRMLIVQAKLEQMVLLTADPVFESYPVETFWCGRG